LYDRGTRRLAFIATGLAVALLPAATGSVPATGSSGARPDVVIVLLDDLPALDGRLVAKSLPGLKAALPIELDMRAHANLCCPDRATLLTGRYTYRHGVRSNELAKKLKLQQTLPVVLNAAGYRTALIGKYLNLYGTCTRRIAWCWDVPPGWDDWFAYSGPPSYLGYEVRIGRDDGSTQLVAYGGDPDDYATDVFAAEAESIIESTPPDEPLFLWFAPFAPHAAAMPPVRHETAECAVPAWTPPNYNVVTPGQPEYVRKRGPYRPRDLTRACRTLLAVDDAFARIRSALLRAGRWENALVIFLSDNSWHEGQHRLREKRAPYDARVSARLSWSSRLGTDVRHVAEPLSTVDVAPTICEAAGCALAWPVHGISFLPVLDGLTPSLGRDVLYEEHLVAGAGVPAWRAVLSTPAHPSGRWHYVEYGTGERELYDLTNDPWELDNKAGLPAYADIQNSLAAALTRESSRP
jgi:N-acetylglucosamine-6-sulfatase